ncbi:MAG: hypothetical protein IJR85_10550 [Synergistaceae bacterium]|nr:hypothetical protein [Synergistaceae bacterium]
MTEIKICVEGTGRLSLLAGMFDALRKTLPGYFTLPEAKDFDALGKAKGGHEDFSDANNSCTFKLKDEALFRFAGSADKNTKIFIVADGEQEVLADALENSKSNMLFLIASGSAAKFGELVELSRTKYRGRSAVAAFAGECADQPVRFIVNFLLNQGVLDSDSARKIAEGTLLDDERCNILCGHELLEPVRRTEPPRKGGFSWKFAAVLVLVLAIAGAGSLWVYRRAHQTVVIYEQTAIESQTKADEEISAAKSAQSRAVRERNAAVNERNTAISERDAALRELETARKIADRLQKENDQLRAELQRMRDNMPKKDGALSGVLKKIGL